MSKIELNVYDLQIKTLDDGRKVAQIDARLAFNNSFINGLEEQGVQEYIPEVKEE